MSYDIDMWSFNVHFARFMLLKNTRNTTTNYVEELEHMAKSLLNYKYLHIFQSLFFCDSKVELDIYYLSSGYVHSSKITCLVKRFKNQVF